MSREVHVRFCESLGVQFPRATRLVILCRSQEQAESALEEVKRWVDSACLTLHPEKTHIVDSREKSFDFLGYSFRGKLRFPRAKSHRQMVDTLRRLTPRKNGQSMEATIVQINRVTVGWFAYFRHCTWNITVRGTSLTSTMGWSASDCVGSF